MSLSHPATLDALTTPAAAIDLDRVNANLDRMAAYTRQHGLALRPHIKTHKTRDLAAAQLARGAVGLTCATPTEAEAMAAVASDLLLAYPPVGQARLDRICVLAERASIAVSLDSTDALDALSRAAAAAGRTIAVLVELDLGMHRVGLADPRDVAALACRATSLPGVRFEGVMFYPGHIREPVDHQDAAIRRLAEDLARHCDALARAGFAPRIVSGGSTPAAFASHRIERLTEIRPGTYVFNDRTTAEIGACAWDDCAYTVLATVISTAVPGQAVVDAGSKAINREELRTPGGAGYGALLDRPDIVIKAMSEEHGILDLSRTDWRPRIGERVRIVPNHVCVSVNLHSVLWGIRGDRVEAELVVAARGWS
jgi:D-serine deaminase-like pyridoxal phosphate-dependent protein